MYLCPILNAGSVSLSSAALLLGKCPRQIRRYVEAGQLRASGGGHGVPFQFAKRDLDAFTRRMGGKTYQRRKAWRGLVDGDTLARIAHASVLRQTDPEKFRHYLEGFTELWTLPEKTVAGLFRNMLPPLASVPESTRQWAARLASSLSPVELDYVAAMFAVRLTPGARLESAETGALGAATDLVKRARPHLFYDEKTFRQSPEAWEAIEDFVRAECRREYPGAFSSEVFSIRRDQFFGMDRTRAWQIYSDNHPLMPFLGHLFIAVHSGNVDAVRQLIMPDKKHKPLFPEIDELRASLTALTKKIRILRERADRNPSGNRVGQVLGLTYRAQGCRVARRVRDKLSRDDVLSLFADYLRCDAPRVWKSFQQRRL